MSSRRKHWLSTLSQKGHAGAQAFLADLYWRGLYMETDRVRGLALITIAVANAPQHERVWIEDIYQNIFAALPTACGRKRRVWLRGGAITSAANPNLAVATTGSARSTPRQFAPARTASLCRR